MEQQTFDLLLLTMSALAVVVFAALYYVRAGYGMFQTSKWGISLNNKLGWIIDGSAGVFRHALLMVE